MSGRSETERPRGRRRRVLSLVGASLFAVVVLAIFGLVAYTQIGVMAAEPEPLATVRADAGIRITDDPAGIVLAPASGDSARGLVFIPGAKVDPWAYAAKLSGLVTDDGLTVVITKPLFNLAFFDLRPLSTFTALAPDVTDWAVGGHSLGGVRACTLAADAEALILFASYCANDLSGSGLPVLSIGGEDDGLSTPSKIADAASLVPSDAVFVEIPGASHASFGDYGPQPGDGTPTISDADMTARISDAVAQFEASVPLP